MTSKIGRNDLCPCGSGKKYKKCCGKEGVPVATNAAGNPAHWDADRSAVPHQQRLAYLGAIGQRRKEYFKLRKTELAKLGTRQREKAASQGLSVSCHDGCSYCCDELVSVSIQESESIVYYLYQHKDLLDRFLQRAPAWFNRATQHEDILIQIAEAKNRYLARGDGAPDEMLETISELAPKWWDLHIPCPFLAEGSCSIYEIRPSSCAGVYSTEPFENCSPSAEVPATTDFILPDVNDQGLPFWDDGLADGWDDLLVNAVYNTLVSGYTYLSTLPGLEDIDQEHSRDPEVRKSLHQGPFTLRPD
jgi:Fe-S-cluster containining protein